MQCLAGNDTFKLEKKNEIMYSQEVFEVKKDRHSYVIQQRLLPIAISKYPTSNLKLQYYLVLSVQSILS